MAGPMIKLPFLGKLGGGPAQADEANQAEAKSGGEGHLLGLRDRAICWWEGYDPDDYARLLRAQGKLVDKPADGPGPNGAADQAGGGPGDPAWPDMELQPIDPANRELPFNPWEESRKAVARYIWGPELCGPGGAENTINMCKLLALKPEMSMVVIGAGLGGHGRALAEEFGCWVTGYESSPQLIKAARQISRAYGMEKKAGIEPLRLDDPDGLGRQYDRAFSKEYLYSMPEKARLIELLHDHLKPTGLLLLTDYVIRDESVRDDPDYKAWVASEPGTVEPVTAEHLSDMFKDRDFVVRVDEDISKKFIPLIEQNWQGADQLSQQLTARPDGQALIRVLMSEGELWQRRLTLLRDGRLAVWRIVASKVGGRPDAMSDW